MILRGSLENFGLVLIALLSADFRTTSWLRLTGDHLSAELALQNGRVVWAACGDQRGLPALDSVVLALDDAIFQFEQGLAPHEQNLDLSVAELLTHLLSLGAPVIECSGTRLPSEVPASPALPRPAPPATQRKL